MNGYIQKPEIRDGIYPESAQDDQRAQSGC